MTWLPAGWKKGDLVCCRFVLIDMNDHCVFLIYSRFRDQIDLEGGILSVHEERFSTSLPNQSPMPHQG